MGALRQAFRICFCNAFIFLVKALTTNTIAVTGSLIPSLVFHLVANWLRKTSGKWTNVAFILLMNRLAYSCCYLTSINTKSTWSLSFWKQTTALWRSLRPTWFISVSTPPPPTLCDQLQMTLGVSGSRETQQDAKPGSPTSQGEMWPWTEEPRAKCLELSDLTPVL